MAPENTVAGLRLAARLGCRGVEFDVMLSRDGVPVLIHDETLERTTSGCGEVAATDLAALRRLDAGLCHAPAFRNERIPLLADALTECDKLGLWANVEIKPAAGHDEETGAVVGAMLARLWGGHGVVSSFSETSLAAARKAMPERDFALLVDAVPADWRDRLARQGCVALHCRAGAVDPGRIAELAAAGVALACYTVNRREEADRLFAAGVSAVFTDRPDLWRPDEM